MKIVKKVGIALSIFVVAALITGYVYESWSESKDAKTYRPVGRLYDIGNKKMHIYTGGTGDKTVVFSSGWGTVNPYVDFYPIYGKVSKYAKVAVYDRFGYGFSDISDEKRDIDTIVKEIHQLLVKAGLKPPYIFVGHSLASLETIRYAQTYKNEVEGIVLIDGGNPELYANTEPLTFISILQKQLIKFGIARILYKTDNFAHSANSERNQLRLLPPELRELDKTSTLLKANNKNITDEMQRSRENAKKVVNGGKLQGIPLTIITSGDFGNASKEWLESQEKLKEWSEISKQFVIQDTKHYIHQYHPETIAGEIVDLIE